VIPTIVPDPTWSVPEIRCNSAFVEVNVEVDTPTEFVFGGAVRLEFDPVSDSTTFAFWIGLLNASRAVTVMRDAVPPPVVHVPVQAVIDD
jgi:hypothetical protein